MFFCKKTFDSPTVLPGIQNSLGGGGPDPVHSTRLVLPWVAAVGDNYRSGALGTPQHAGRQCHARRQCGPVAGSGPYRHGLGVNPSLVGSICPCTPS